MADDEYGYEPDLTIEEALRKGLIAVIDTGTMGTGFKGYCGHMSADSEHTCTRQTGHEGVHAQVVRWHAEEPVTKPTAADWGRMTESMKEMAAAARSLKLPIVTTTQSIAVYHDAYDDAVIEAEERIYNRKNSMVDPKRKTKITPKGKR